VLLPAPGEMVMIEQDFHDNGSIEPLATILLFSRSMKSRDCPPKRLFPDGHYLVDLTAEAFPVVFRQLL
jgi:hypothetical protein